MRGISYHHYPEVDGDLICYVVALADIVSKHIDKKLDINTTFSENGSIMERLRINPKGLEKICNSVTLKYEDLRKKYN